MTTLVWCSEARGCSQPGAGRSFASADPAVPHRHLRHPQGPGRMVPQAAGLPVTSILHSATLGPTCCSRPKHRDPLQALGKSVLDRVKPCATGPCPEPLGRPLEGVLIPQPISGSGTALPVTSMLAAGAAHGRCTSDETLWKQLHMAPLVF